MSLTSWFFGFIVFVFIVALFIYTLMNGHSPWLTLMTGAVAALQFFALVREAVIARGHRDP